MRLRLSEPSPTELRATLSMEVGAQFFGSALGLFFLVVGVLFLFSALPHTDELRLERRGGQVLARKWQALAGRWELNSQRAVFGPNTTAGALRREDEGSVTYQAALVSEGQEWPFGKSVADQAAAQELVQRLNRFLTDPQSARFEWRQKTWWWFLLPFGLGGVAVGLAVIAFCNHQDKWRFNQIGSEVVCCRRYLLYWRTRRWPLHEIRRAVVHQHTDNEGDTFHNVRLELRSGAWVAMGSASHQMDSTGGLQAGVDRINRFLGIGSQPVQVVDDRKPPPDPAEVEEHLQRLAATHPRLARRLGQLVHWGAQLRSLKTMSIDRPAASSSALVSGFAPLRSESAMIW